MAHVQKATSDQRQLSSEPKASCFSAVLIQLSACFWRCGRGATDPSWGQRDARIDLSKSPQLQFYMTQPFTTAEISELTS